MNTILIFILVLSVLVLVHELGHFLVAKLFKIKVEEFGFGLPPRAFGIKRGETIYSINWLPVGGFVKLYGEDEAGSGKPTLAQQKKYKDIERTFFARPAWQRAAVIVAGVAMNFLLAVSLISYLFSAVGVPVAGDKVVVVSVAKNSPAQQAGLREGDTVEKINGTVIKSPDELTSNTKKLLGQKINLEIKTKEGESKNVQIQPRTTYPKNEGPMGVSIARNLDVKKYPWYEAPVLGTQEALSQSWMIVSGIGMMLYNLFAFGEVPKDVAGPVGIAQLTGQFVQIGTFAILSFVALLSLNLAILNILPFPALDGGRLFFIVVEVITGKKVNQKFESYAHAAGMIILLGLIAIITIHDLVRLFTGQPILPKIQ